MQCLDVLFLEAVNAYQLRMTGTAGIALLSTCTCKRKCK